MKARSILMLAALFTLALSVAIVAAPNKKTIQLTDPTLVGNVTLRPGDYTIEWTVPGPDVQVGFSQGQNTLVTVPATLDRVRSQHGLSVTCRTQDSGACSLVKIETKNATLLFAPRGMRVVAEIKHSQVATNRQSQTCGRRRCEHQKLPPASLHHEVTAAAFDKTMTGGKLSERQFQV
jgi:hypothetical protein